MSETLSASKVFVNKIGNLVLSGLVGHIHNLAGKLVSWWTANFQSASGVDPTLALEFHNDRYMADGVEKSFADLITFTRASEATRVNASGLIEKVVADVARLDHDKDGNPLGLLVEEARTNILQRSAEFDNAYWSKLNASVVANAATAPDGATTADKVVEDTSTGEHAAYRTGISIGSLTDHSISVYAKAAERSFLSINSNMNGYNKTIFNLSTGAVHSTGTGHTARIEPAANGWYRCSVTVTATSTSGREVYYGTGDDAGNASYTGDGSSGIFVWGAQLEAGSFATSYIPTTTASVTRAADVPDVATSGFGFNAGAGSWLAIASTPGDGDNAFIFELNAGGAADRHYMRHVSSAPRFDFAIANGAGNDGAFNTSYTFNSGQVYKSALGYDTDDMVGYLDGSQAGTDATVDPPSGLTTINLGNARGNNHLNGHIRALVYYDERIPNSDLVALTS